MSRRPKTFLLLTLMGAVSPFQASSGPIHPIQAATTPTGDSLDASLRSRGLYAATMPTGSTTSGASSSRLPYFSRGAASRLRLPANKAVGRRPSSSSKSIVVVRKDSGLVLQSTVCGLVAPLLHGQETQSYYPRSGAVAGIAPFVRSQPTTIRTLSVTQQNLCHIGQFAAKAAGGVMAVELAARLVGLTAGGITVIVPAILTPAVDQTASLLSLILGPLFTVKLWSTLAPFASIALKLSPMPTIQTVRRNGTTGGLPLLPYSAMCTMTFVLVAYGLLIRDTKVLITHGMGHLISLYYCLMFYRNVDKKATNLPGTVDMHAWTGLGIAAAITTAIVAMGRNAAPTVGMTSVLLSCLMYTGPLAALKQAIQSKSAKNIPLPYAVASSVNALAWLVYGYWGIHDFMIWAPCLIGFVSATAQISVNIAYGNE